MAIGSSATSEIHRAELSQAFFDQIDDEIRGLLGKNYSAFRIVRTSRLIKLALPNPSIHFEAQLISRRWAPSGARGKETIEVGLHLEARSASESEKLLQELTRKRGWKTKLPNAEAGKAFGPQASAWRRISEVLLVESEDDPEVASEVAERLASYVKALGTPAGALVADDKDRRVRKGG